MVSVTHEELAQALARGTLIVPLNRAVGVGDTAIREGGETLDEATVARICRVYGPETLAANLLWEVAQAGESGIVASELKEALSLKGSKALAGIFSGLGKTLAREVPGQGHLFIAREWRRDTAEYHYRMPASARKVVSRIYG